MSDGARRGGGEVGIQRVGKKIPGKREHGCGNIFSASSRKNGHAPIPWRSLPHLRPALLDLLRENSDKFTL